MRHHQYAFGTAMEFNWHVGSAWRNMAPGDTLVDSGEVLEIDAPNRLVLSWRQEIDPSLRAEGSTRLTYLLEFGNPGHKYAAMAVAIGAMKQPQ
jgi:uncharacterized protein YndB with AHSA1/START domain